MDKTAKTEYPVTDLLRKRWSPRAFTDKPLTEQDVRTLLEAATWAPSAFNEQPWLYRYALKGSKGFETLLSCLNKSNQEWVIHTSALMSCCARKFSEVGNFPLGTYGHDCGLANENMLLQATSMGFFGHAMSGFDKQKTLETCGFDGSKVDPICFIAFGYLSDDLEQLSDKNKAMELAPRTRKTIDEVAIMLR